MPSATRPDLRALAAELWRDGRGPILASIAVGHLLTLGTRLALPALLPGIASEFALDNATAGLLVGLMWVAYATTQFPGGLLADRVGERVVLAASPVLAAAGLIVAVSLPAFPAFALGVAVLGLGAGLYGTTRVTALSDVYPERSGTAIGITQSAGNLGTAGLPVVAAVVAGWAGWRAGLGIVVPPLLLTGVALWVAVPARTSGRGEDARSGLRALRRFVRSGDRRPVLVATGGMTVMTFIYQGFTAFFPTYLVESKGFPESTAAAMLGVFFAGGVLAQLLAGGLADRYGERPTLVVAVGVTVATLASFPFLGSTWTVGVAAAVASVQLGFWPVVFSYVMGVLPEEVQGTGFGLLRTGFLYVGTTGPPIVGALADARSFDLAFLFLAAAAVVGVVLSASLPAATSAGSPRP